MNTPKSPPDPSNDVLITLNDILRNGREISRIISREKFQLPDTHWQIIASKTLEIQEVLKSISKKAALHHDFSPPLKPQSKAQNKRGQTELRKVVLKFLKSKKAASLLKVNKRPLIDFSLTSLR